MRVALIGPVPPALGGATPGGVATHQVHLAAGLAACGMYAPLLATNTRPGPSARHATGDEAAFPLHRLSPPALSVSSAARLVRYGVRLSRTRVAGSRREILANLLFYERFLAEVRPQVIHVQHPLERALYARMVRTFEGWHMPLVITAHSLFGEHAEHTIQTLMAPNLRAADRVIAVSEHIAEQAVSLGVAPDRVRVIRSGVDLAQSGVRDRHAARAALGIAADTPLVLFVGNLEPRKQVDVLLQAMALVRAAVPSSELVIVGSGESAGADDQTARLRRLTDALALHAAVRFVGRIPDAQLRDYYAAADVFALPSSSEAQGIVALEAMAAGLPVVASAVGGLLGTIAHGETGLLVPSADVTRLADGLVKLLVDPALRRTIAAAARQSVERNFSWLRAVDATIDVYHEALGHQPP